MWKPRNSQAHSSHPFPSQKSGSTGRSVDRLVWLNLVAVGVSFLLWAWPQPSSVAPPSLAAAPKATESLKQKLLTTFPTLGGQLENQANFEVGPHLL
ncbi:MAG: hypothetical protein WCS37_20040, partial [Chloroflexota bacterium]